MVVLRRGIGNQHLASLLLTWRQAPYMEMSFLFFISHSEFILIPVNIARPKISEYSCLVNRIADLCDVVVE